MNTPAIRLRDVVRRYGAVVALDGVSIDIAAGERLALLGHNGAGKTTLLKLVLGLIRPDSGHAEVAGRLPEAHATKARLAYLPENVAFHRALTAREQLRLFLRLKRRPAKDADDLLERVGLAAAADRRIATFSKGMRQRLGLAQILIGAPEVVVLDEPTTGLDPVSRELFYETVAGLAAGGAAVIQSSHALTEVEARTDRIAILSAGRMVADSHLSDLRTAARLPIRLRIRAAPEAVGSLVERMGATRINGVSAELTCAAGDKMRRLADVTAFGEAIRDIDVVPPSLEDVYRHYSRAEAGGKEHP